MFKGNVSFHYVDMHDCNLNDPEYKNWGCCCQCENRVEVAKHCCHSGKTDRCVCSDSLGFYICLLFYVMGETDFATLSGEHGVCEGFRKRK